MNVLRTNEKLNAASSEAYVGVEGEQLHVGSIELHEILKMLKQSGDLLTHSFKRMTKNKTIVNMQYTFERNHVEKFVKLWCNAAEYNEFSFYDMKKALSA